MSEQSLPQIQPIINPRIKNRTGQRYGRWLVLGYTGSDSRGQSTWLCKCDCGNHSVISQNNLGSGASLSCGCLHDEMLSEYSTSHGLAHRTPEYNTWVAMRQRCRNPKNQNYPIYGGRGITIDPAWEDFAVFLRDVGPKPSPKHSLDRINPDGNYEKGNVRWATQIEQCNNLRKNRVIEFGGEALTMSQWGTKTGLGGKLIAHRIDKLGWPIGRALTTPVNRTGGRK